MIMDDRGVSDDDDRGQEGTYQATDTDEDSNPPSPSRSGSESEAAGTADVDDNDHADQHAPTVIQNEEEDEVDDDRATTTSSSDDDDGQGVTTTALIFDLLHRANTGAVALKQRRYGDAFDIFTATLAHVKAQLDRIEMDRNSSPPVTPASASAPSQPTTRRNSSSAPPAREGLRRPRENERPPHPPPAASRNSRTQSAGDRPFVTSPVSFRLELLPTSYHRRQADGSVTPAAAEQVEEENVSSAPPAAAADQNGNGDESTSTTTTNHGTPEDSSSAASLSNTPEARSVGSSMSHIISSIMYLDISAPPGGPAASLTPPSSLQPSRPSAYRSSAAIAAPPPSHVEEHRIGAGEYHRDRNAPTRNHAAPEGEQHGADRRRRSQQDLLLLQTASASLARIAMSIMFNLALQHHMQAADLSVPSRYIERYRAEVSSAGPISSDAVQSWKRSMLHSSASLYRTAFAFINQQFVFSRNSSFQEWVRRNRRELMPPQHRENQDEAPHGPDRHGGEERAPQGDEQGIENEGQDQQQQRPQRATAQQQASTNANSNAPGSASSSSSNGGGVRNGSRAAAAAAPTAATMAFFYFSENERTTLQSCLGIVWNNMADLYSELGGDECERVSRSCLHQLLIHLAICRSSSSSPSDTSTAASSGSTGIEAARGEASVPTGSSPNGAHVHDHHDNNNNTTNDADEEHASSHASSGTDDGDDSDVVDATRRRQFHASSSSSSSPTNGSHAATCGRNTRHEDQHDDQQEEEKEALAINSEEAPGAGDNDEHEHPPRPFSDNWADEECHDVSASSQIETATRNSIEPARGNHASELVTPPGIDGSSRSVATGHSIRSSPSPDPSRSRSSEETTTTAAAGADSNARRRTAAQIWLEIEDQLWQIIATHLWHFHLSAASA